MSSKQTAVFGIYATPGTAEAAVDHLIAAGFGNAAISVLLPDDDTTRAFAHEKHTKAPEGTATGATTGGIVGGSLGLLAGIGALAIPGVGPLIAAGPIMATLAGIGAGGAVGGVVGALVGMGIPEFEAKRYEGAVKDGGTLLSVHCDTSEQVDSAKQALKDTGARDVSSTGEAGASKESRKQYDETYRRTA
jgi:tetrahydromethanopterin S-methyltransferase subunit C